MELMRIKNEHPVAKKWDGIEFMRYLYHIFPEAVNLQKDEKINIQRVVGTKGENFNNVQMPAVIWNKKIVKTRKIKQDSLIKSTIESLTLNKKKSKKMDFDKRQHELSTIGYKGESLVIDYERKRLKDYPDLVRKIKQVSKEDDSLGFDIKSFELDGSPRFIEVKTSKENENNRLNFFVSLNELIVSQNQSNYWLYRVLYPFGTPKIIKLKNPFGKDSMDKISLTPVNFSVQMDVE